MRSRLRNPKSRKGVVFIEICLDAQGVNVDSLLEDADVQQLPEPKNIEGYTTEILNSLSIANRPVLLIGGGISRQTSSRLLKELELSGIPIMTTWNGADRYPHSPRNYWGRPNTWGMRYANILIQQSDLVIALGTRLGLQQTGFNWKEFVPFGKVIQVDIDAHELSKGHPAIHIGIEADANLILTDLVSKINIKANHFAEWLEFGDKVKNYFPLSEAINGKFTGYWNPYDFVLEISSKLQSGDSLIPSSSGSAETVTMQAALLAEGVKVVTDKGMASMGYGLGGAIGAAFQSNGRVIHIEGDGGFSQNLQDLATVAINQLNIKIFILDNGGYASIRMTQMNYFDGAFIGCDSDSGLGMPNWQKLFDAYGIPVVQLSPEVGFNKEILSKLTSESPQAFIVPIHPEQTYFPKITSRVLGDGKMQSNPLHDMTPELTETEKVTFLRYLKP